MSMSLQGICHSIFYRILANWDHMNSPVVNLKWFSDKPNEIASFQLSAYIFEVCLNLIFVVICKLHVCLCDVDCKV